MSVPLSSALSSDLLAGQAPLPQTGAAAPSQQEEVNATGMARPAYIISGLACGGIFTALCFTAMLWMAQSEVSLHAARQRDNALPALQSLSACITESAPHDEV